MFFYSFANRELRTYLKINKMNIDKITRVLGQFSVDQGWPGGGTGLTTAVISIAECKLHVCFMLTVNKMAQKPIHFASKVCQQIRFWLLFGLGTPPFWFWNPYKNMKTCLLWHGIKLVISLKTGTFYFYFHRQRVNLHTKCMVSLSLHYLERKE